MKGRSAKTEWERRFFLSFFPNHFTQFNRTTVNGPFFIGAQASIKKCQAAAESGAVVLFTDDWLASQNHQIHLPTVTFITVIFKVTATCLVSQHWPQHIYSHLLSPSLHLSSSLFLSLSIQPFSPPQLFLLLTTFIRLSISPPLTPCWHLFYHSAGQRFREIGVREEWRRGKGKTGGRKWDPHVLHCTREVCSEALTEGANNFPFLMEESSIPTHEMTVNETFFPRRVFVQSCIYKAALIKKEKTEKHEICRPRSAKIRF